MAGADKQFFPAALAGDNPGYAEKDAAATGPYAEMLRKVDAVLREVFPEDFRPQLSFQHEDLGFVDWKTQMPTESATLRIHLPEGLAWQENEILFGHMVKAADYAGALYRVEGENADVLLLKNPKGMMRGLAALAEESNAWQRNELKRSIYNLCQKKVTSMNGAGQGRLC